MADPTYPAFSILVFIAFVLVLIPLPWHLQAWNSGTCLLMIWLAVGCLNLFVNSIVWHNNIVDRAPIWCDISSQIIVALNVAIPASTLCIMRRLYNIASCKTASVTVADKRKQVYIDLAIGVGLPILQLPLHFVVQGHRYDIFEDIGCYPITFNTIPAYPLSFLWPNVLGFISLIYSILTLHAFMKRRAQFSQFVSAHSSLNVSRYLRLMALATTEMLFNIPLCSYGLYLNVTRGKIHPWKSWEDTHFDYWIVDKFPAILWRRNHDAVVMMELNRWSLVVAAFVFFGFFGFADEARKNYKKAAYTVAKTLGIPLPKSNKTSNPSSSMLKDMKGAPRPLVLSSGPGSLPLYLQSKSTQSTTFSSTRNSRSSVSGTSLHKSDFSSTAAPSTPPLPAYKLSESLPTTPITADSSEASYDIDLEVYQRPMSTITVSSATYAPSSTIPNSSPPPIRGAITSAGIPIEERIADPAELSRAVGPNSPLHPSSHWPRAV